MLSLILVQKDCIGYDDMGIWAQKMEDFLMIRHKTCEGLSARLQNEQS